MAKIDAIEIPKLLFDEGAAPSTPASTNVAVYAKADGLMYSKDDAGTETLMSTGGTSGIPAGTSNPGAPATNDLFFRTDLALLIYYTGTAWRTVQEFSSTIALQDVLAGGAAATHTHAYLELDNATYDLYVTRIACSTTVLTTNSGSAFWTVAFNRQPSATSLGSFSTGTTPDTASTNTRHDVAVGALTGTTDRYITINATKTSTPGNIYILATAFWRKVIT